MPYQPAILGKARLGNFRLGYRPAALVTLRSTRVTILIAGVLANARVRMSSLSIRDVLNDAPNTCIFTVDGTAPIAGQDVRITINSDAPRLLFNGTIQTVDQSYEGKPTQLAWACRATDDTARVNRKRPFGTWTNVSATTIAQYLVTTFAPGFTSTHVQAGLPAVSVNFDGSEGFSGCIRQLAQLIGGYFYFEDLHLHLFQTEATDAPATLTSASTTLLHSPPINASVDDSQRRTRDYGKGHGEATLLDIPVGATVIPVESAAYFNAAGGSLICGTQRLTYTGLSATAQTGSTAETLAPTQGPQAATGVLTGQGLSVGNNYSYGVTFVLASGDETPMSPISNVYVAVTDGGGASLSVNVTNIPNPTNPTITGKHLYRTVGNGTVYKKVTTGGPLALTTTSRVDGTADASLGAAVASRSTGVDVGATSIQVLDTAQFGASGGYVLTANQLIRYTGRSVSSGVGSLTGIPASGTGSIVAPIPSGSAISNLPCLQGIPASGSRSVQVAIKQGDMVHVWVERNDTAAQAALIALDAAQGRVSDGIVEHLITDGRRTEASLIALCDADLALYSRPLVTVTYASRDVKTKSGKPIVVNLTSPLINETLTIQDVTITEIDIAPGLAPKFSTTASSVRHSLEDILRRLMTAQAA